MEWLTSFTQWITDLIKGLWSDFVNYINDLWIGIASQILSVISSAINAIPVPDFVNTYSIGTILNLLPNDLAYFVSQLYISESLHLIAAGFAFRMTRKALTLFRW